MKKYLLLLPLLCGIFQSFSQYVGIGTTTPLARLHVTDSSVLFSAVGMPPGVLPYISVSGAGRRMMWIANRAAFRAGYVDGVQWDKDSIGVMSTAFGRSTVASGTYSVSMGYLNKAQGQESTALGSHSVASGQRSTAMGYETQAIGHTSTAMGDNSMASGSSSTAIGFNTVASGNFSTAIGVGVHAKASGSIAIGVYNDVSDNPNPVISYPNDRIFQVGNGTSVSRNNAITVLRSGNTGINTTTPEGALHVVGEENDGTNAALKIESGSQRMHFDGNEIDGYSTAGASNSLYIQNNSIGDLILVTGGGKVGININPSTSTFEVNGTAAKPGGGSWAALSDERMKQQVKPYTDGLQKVMQIMPVSFHYNHLSGYNTNDEHVGVLAQQLKTIAPYMTGTVQKDGQEYLTADNSAMIYMLVNAVKELAKQNEKLQAEVEQLRGRMK